jgi:hypothetical protein
LSCLTALIFIEHHGISNLLQLFITSKDTHEDGTEDPINAVTLRHEFKAASVTQGSDNLLHIDSAVKSSTKVQRVHSRVYTGTVHASLKFLPNRNWYPGVRYCCLSSFACVMLIFEA